MVSAWIEHVKAVQAKEGCSYKDALKIASKSYKPAAKKGKGMEGGDLISDLVGLPGQFISDQIAAKKRMDKVVKRGPKLFTTPQGLADLGKSILLDNPQTTLARSALKSPFGKQITGPLNKELGKKLKGKGVDAKKYPYLQPLPGGTIAFNKGKVNPIPTRVPVKVGTQLVEVGKSVPGFAKKALQESTILDLKSKGGIKVIR